MFRAQLRIAQKSISDLTQTNEAQQARILELSDEVKLRAENELKIMDNHRSVLAFIPQTRIRFRQKECPRNKSRKRFPICAQTHGLVLAKLIRLILVDLEASEEETEVQSLHPRFPLRNPLVLTIFISGRQELRSQTRLSELYRASSEDAQCKADELTQATEELQRLLRDASARYGQLETSSRAEADEHQERAERDRRAIEALRTELERANELLEATKARAVTDDCVEALAPSAAAASRYHLKQMKQLEN